MHLINGWLQVGHGLECGEEEHEGEGDGDDVLHDHPLLVRHVRHRRDAHL